MRHGTTEWNMGRICQGQTDIPLHDIGRNEAHELAILNNTEISCVFYSPLQRASETALIVTKHLTCPKIVIDGLQERHYGDLQGKPWTLSHEEFAKIYKIFIPPNGELWEEFSARIVNVINHGLSSTECPLFVSHAGVFRAVIDALQVSSPGINNCELIKFVHDDQANQWRAIRVNN